MTLIRITAALLAATALWALPAQAQGGRAEALAQLEREQVAFDRQIATKKAQIAELQRRPSPERAELDEARATVEAARVALASEPGAEAEARLKNAEFKLTLAERKFNKGNAEIEALNDEIAQLQRQIATRQQQARALQSTPAAPPAPAPAEQARREQQARELARSREQTEAQQREIERLKALLAARESAAADQAAAAPTPTPAPEPAPAEADTEARNGLERIAGREAMLAALQTLERRLEGLGPRERGGINATLYLKPAQREATNRDRITLKALGGEQYRGEGELSPGRYEIIIGFNRWPFEAGPGDSGDFVFLYDNSQRGQPRLTLYPASLER